MGATLAGKGPKPSIARRVLAVGDAEGIRRTVAAGDGVGSNLHRGE
jgi:hypothetical protein